MTKLQLLFGFGAALGVVIASTSGCSRAAAQQAAAPASRTVDLTIYSGGFGMVSEHRPVHLTSGRNRIVLDGISKMLDASSILVDWPRGSTHPEVVGTTYDLDRTDGNSLIHRLNGKQVEFMWASSDGKPGETLTGKLEAGNNDNSFALRTSDRLYISPNGTLIAPADTPSGAPEISVQVNSPSESNTNMGVSYLSGGMGWKADYVAKINPGSETADLECWASIINKTGTSYSDARITLVAGQPKTEGINSEMGTQLRSELTLGIPVASLAVHSNGFTAASNAPRSALGDLYAYKISSVASVSNDQTNRVSVLGTRTVPINRVYTISLPEPSEMTADRSDGSAYHHIQAQASIAFMNVGSSNLGIPLPAGQVRVYERDPSGAEQFIGSDTITDTSKGSHVSFTMSNAFDVFANPRLLSRTSIGKHHARYVFEVTISNEKKESAPVIVNSALPDTHHIVSESIKGVNASATERQWRLTLKPGETRKITCTVES